MGVLDVESQELRGKIVYAGPSGAGKSANLELLARKLKNEHRGQLETLTDPSGESYEYLPVALGEIRGYRTSIQIYSAPNGPEAAETRRDLLSDADGIAFIADLRPERHQATREALEEIRSQLSSAGRSLQDLVVIVQYNHRDAVDENALESLHRELELGGTTSLEAVAHEGKGVLQTLTTLSKQVLASIRQATQLGDTAPALEPAEPVVAQEPESDLPVAEPIPVEAELAGPEDARFALTMDAAYTDPDGSLVVPIVLSDDGSGEKIELSLRIELRAR